MILQSVGWWCFVPKLLTPEQFIRAAADAGFPALDLVPADFLPVVKDHGLAISSIQGHLPLEIGLNRRDQHERIHREMRTAIEYAQRLGIPNVLCFSGNREGLDDTEGIKITAAGLAPITQVAEEAGVTLVLELLNSKVDHPDYQADHTVWGLKVCETAGSSRVKLLYDIYHMQIMEGDIIRTIRSFHDRIGLFHTAGNPGRNDLDSAQELNYSAILNAIKETGYSGYVAHEFIPKGDPAVALRTVYRESAQALA
ncbi:MAG: TIM barrel protein [Verrucomicrobia bacterium]|nr:TIM barrel protein [Verrucomicrobiota bacterium]MBV9276520.1 TIM barrel protein [Verrucomicrobiota bacterium]